MQIAPVATSPLTAVANPYRAAVSYYEAAAAGLRPGQQFAPVLANLRSALDAARAGADLIGRHTNEADAVAAASRAVNVLDGISKRFAVAAAKWGPSIPDPLPFEHPAGTMQRFGRELVALAERVDALPIRSVA